MAGFMLLPAVVFSQTSTESIRLDWKDYTIQDPVTGVLKKFMEVPEKVWTDRTSGCPVFSIKRPAAEGEQFKVTISEAVYEACPSYFQPTWSQVNRLPKTEAPEILVTHWRDNHYASVRFSAVRENPTTHKPERLTQFNLNWIPEKKFISGNRAVQWKSHSILSSGKLIRIKIPTTGLYKIDRGLLTKMGFNMDQIDPRNIKIYGMGGGMLPQNSAASFYNDPEEMHIKVSGEQDGRFDNEDYILFFARGPHTWNYDATSRRYIHQYHIYSEETAVYLSIGNTPGLRIQKINGNSGNGQLNVNAFDDIFFYEKELTNLDKSGREWYGETFDKVTEQTFSFNFTDPVLNDTFYIHTEVAGRSFERTNTPGFNIYINNNFNSRINLPWTTPTYGDPYMMPGESHTSFPATSSAQVKLQYEKSGDFSAIGWLNYIEVTARRNLRFSGNSLFFRDSKSIGLSEVKYTVSGAGGNSIWDITDPVHPAEILGNSVNGGVDLEFYANNVIQREYVVIGNNFSVPEFWNTMGNQDLHATPAIDMVILTHPDFKAAANRYADYKKASGLTVLVTDPQTIYNEFSCGVQDITAIRNFMKMLYDRGKISGNSPKYLFILADGSYDYKDRIKNNTNFVPTYQSFDSYSSGSFCNDEYYGTLDDGEGYLSDSRAEGLDVAVGRVPVESLNEAQQMVDKLMHYNNPASFGDWRQYITFIGDDGDNNVHESSADRVAGYAQSAEPGLNLNKLYLDAYEKKIVDGVPSYPDVHDELIRLLDRGCLIVNYSGHGGPYQWAHEKIFDVSDIDNLKNYHHLPIFMAATCDFGPFDDPEFRSAGERLMLSTKGGGIAYLGTSRIANTGQNDPFNAGLFVNNMFKIQNGRYPTIGEAYVKLKANSNMPDPLRNFFLMGDPSMDLGLPVNVVNTTHINQKPVNTQGDTIQALQTVTIAGNITDLNGHMLSDFNGTIFPTVFDKEMEYKTLGNDPGSPVTTFKQQKNAIFRGAASVVNGQFQFSFIVPKDINYRLGPAKISYYAFDLKYQAKGYYNNLILGGTADTSYADHQGPDINIYLNDEKFAYGGMTNQDPLMIVKLQDSSGINSVGAGVGRNITATLDGEKIYIINDYYQSEKDNFRKGSVRYQLVGIEDGKHTLRVKAWDVLNNSGESETSFVVAQDATLIIRNILNYPNPFTTKTAFHFDHNKPGEMLEVQVQIMSITGQTIKNLFTTLPADGSHFDQLDWDGRDEFGSPIGRGVYLYKLTVKTGSGEFATEKGKLVILQ